MNIFTETADDELGPSKVVFVRDRRAGLTGIVVVDNVASGPALGGVRMAPDINVHEVARLARAMTLKNAAAGLPHGGGKAGLVGDPAMSLTDKESLVRSFAHAIRELNEYIPGPDMGLDEACMAWIKDQIGRAVGLPRVLGGIPLDEIGATGLGLAVAAEVAAPYADLKLRGARVAVQGFGAVGKHAARFLCERGAHLVAATDSQGGTFNAGGLDLGRLLSHKADHRPLREFPGGTPITADEMIAADCDIWIPAARPDVLHSTNVQQLKCRLVLQGANIPATAEAELWMHEHGIVNVPDFIANAGGVICASVEHHGGTESQALAVVEERIRQNVSLVLERSRTEKRQTRNVATELARERVRDAMRYRRYA